METSITIIGYGSVASCLLPLLLNHGRIAPERIRILNRLPAPRNLEPLIVRGLRYLQVEITRENYAEVLRTHVPAGGFLIDLAVNLNTFDLIQWCRENRVLFLNASVEEWEPFADAGNRTPQERTLYHRQMRLLPLRHRPGPTAVVDHGANPGLVSHFVKKALLDLAHHSLPALRGEVAERVQDALRDSRWNELAWRLGVKVIHISERDTQRTSQPRRPGEFVNTWSVDGFCEEALAPAEMGWGTHELFLPQGAFQHASGPKNQICLSRPGYRTRVYSWVPSGPIVGMVIRHGEAFGISEHLSVSDAHGLVYRPTVHYAYCPCDEALASLWDWEMQGLPEHTDQRIANTDIVDGHDELGVLLLGPETGGWWTGSILDIHEARELVPGQNATTVQVAAGLYAAVRWMVANPERGLLLPDELPWEPLLDTARPWLGDFVSIPTDWTPATVRQLRHYFGKWDGRGAEIRSEFLWQFPSFLVD